MFHNDEKSLRWSRLWGTSSAAFEQNIFKGLLYTATSRQSIHPEQVWS